MLRPMRVSAKEGGRKGGRNGADISNDVVVTRDHQIACHNTIRRRDGWWVGLDLRCKCETQLSFNVRTQFWKDISRNKCLITAVLFRWGFKICHYSIQTPNIDRETAI